MAEAIIKVASVLLKSGKFFLILKPSDNRRGSAQPPKGIEKTNRYVSGKEGKRMGKSTEQRIWDRVKIAQLILLAAAFLLFLGGCGREGAPADAAARTGATIQTGTATRTEAVTKTGTATRTETTAPKPGLQNADTLVFLSGGVDIENFGSAAWTGGSVK